MRRDGDPVSLPPKDLETLLVLVQRSGHIVEKEELLERVWPGVFIEEGNLARHIFNLRQVLGDSPEGRKYIETIPKRGYRFVAVVRDDKEPETVVTPSARPFEAVQKTTNSDEKRSWWFGALALSVTLAAILIVSVRHYWAPREPSPQKAMLAVLPFANLNGDAGQDYFADGLTEEMITQLGQLQPTRLGVIARTSAMRYKNSRQSAAEICRELGVNYLLEGSVRQAGQRVRIAAQLIQASDQTHLWAESYDAPVTDILNTQREIAAQVTHSLRVELLPARARNNPSPHFEPEAYRKYLLGLTELRKGTREGIQGGIRYFQDAIEADPQNARLYAALAQAHSLSQPYYTSPSVAFPLAKQAALNALRLDPDLAGPHVTLADAHLLFDWDWAAADAEYRRALEINPSSSEAQLGYANYLSTLGHHDEAVSHVRQAYLVDPISPASRNEALWVHYFSGRMQETAEQAEKTIEMEPQAGEPYALLALAYADMGRPTEAQRAADSAVHLSQNSPSEIATAASALARAGQKAAARRLLEKALKLAKTQYVCRFIVAGVYADLGEDEKALESLQQGFLQRST